MSDIVDGLGTKIDFASYPTFKMTNVSIKVPGITPAGAIDMTNLESDEFTEKAPKTLKEVSDLTGSAVLDSEKVYSSAPYRLIDTITVTLPDGATYVFAGYLDGMEPGEATPGEKIEVSFTIIVTNRLADGTKQKPVHTAAGA